MRARNVKPQTRKSEWAFWLVAFVLTGVLAASALMKVHLLLTDPFADIRVGVPASLIIASTCVELFAVIFVLGSRHSKTVHSVLLATFAVFLLVSAINVLLGANKCACGGALQLPPIVFLGIDVLALIALFFVRPPVAGTERPFPWNWVQFALGVVTVFAGYAFANHSAAGRELIARYLSDREVLSDAVELGKKPINETARCELKLRNVSAQSVHVVGVKKSCSCIIPENRFPMAIRPGESAELAIQVKPDKAGDMHQRIRLFLDSKRQPYLDINVFAFFH
jgi:Protein of unknown function (DUF1573)